MAIGLVKAMTVVITKMATQIVALKYPELIIQNSTFSSASSSTIGLIDYKGGHIGGLVLCDLCA